MLPQHLLQKLEMLLPKKIFTSMDILKTHTGRFYINNYLPDAVCYAESEEDVIQITNFCIQHTIPLIPYGSGTSVEGHIAAINGGICLNLSKMNKIIQFSPADGYVIVQPGIPYNELNQFLEPHGFHFPVEAGWGASIGGMASTNASGAGATDSGSMAKNVMGCKIVVYKEKQACKIETGTRSPKSSAGYNLTSLFIGSEGTLGIMTELCLKIRRNFSSYKTICCQFDEIQQAVDFVVAMKGLIQFRRVELLDKLQTAACAAYSNVDYLYLNKDTVLIELAGNELAITEEMKLIIQYLNQHSVENIKTYDDRKSSETVWMMRKNACPAAIKWIDQNKKPMATDVSVPISKLSECIQACYAHMQRLGLKAPLVAHVGDGNFHFTILVNPEDKRELQKAMDFNHCVVEESLKVGGTCTGEHGIGIGKKSYLESEHRDSLFLMSEIKRTFDPLNIFNPGKIIGIDHQPCHTPEKKSNAACLMDLFPK